MKKWIILTVCLLIALACAAAEADVLISEANFEDPVFRTYISQNVDKDGNGSLNAEELDSVIDLFVMNMGIKSLKGIEFFPRINRLYCDENELTSLDVSHNTLINGLSCMKNQLTSLDVSSLTGLRLLSCRGNKIASLDLSHNPSLESLDVCGNQLKTLDLSNNIHLFTLSCYGNQIMTLDVSKCLNFCLLVHNPRSHTHDYNLDVDYDYWESYIKIDRFTKVISDDYISEPSATPTPVPTQPVVNTPAPPENPADPAVPIVGGLKYRLSGSNAAVTAPKDKSAKKLTIPSTIKVSGKTYNVTEIKAGAFKGMKNLTTVTIGANVKTIGKSAFQNCAKLKTITIKTKKLTGSSVKSSAFKGIYRKATFKCPKGKADAYKKILLKKGAPNTCKFK